MMSPALTLAGLTVLTVLALLAIPVWLVIDIERRAALRADVRIRWLFGLVRLDLQPATPRSARARPGADRGKPARQRSPRSWRGGSRRGLATGLAVVRSPGFVRRVARLIADVAGRVQVEGVYLRAEFGLEDPADTGRLYGLVVPVLLAANSAGVDLQCQPDFVHPGLRGVGGGRLGFRPLSIIGVLAAFACSVPTLRAMRSAWVSRR